MKFAWLNAFQQDMDKPDNYAEKVLAQYKMGMKAKGSIAGVRVIVGPDNCAACETISAETIYHPDDAPRLPLDDCLNNGNCRCVYRPVMNYQIDDSD